MKLSEGSQRYVAEFLGTYMLVFSIGCNVLAGQKSNHIWLPTSIACTLTVLVYIFGSVSGANFNPAVSICLGLANKKKWPEVIIYCVIQMLAGILAAFSYCMLLWESFELHPQKGYTWWQAGLAEILYTCMLCFVVLHVDGSVEEFFRGGDERNGAHKNQYFGLAIGFVLMAALPAGGHISGGCYNPAVALGIDFSSTFLRSYWWISYTLFEIVGAALAFALFTVTDPTSTRKPFGRSMVSKLIAEFIGTFFLVLTAGLNVMGKSNTPVFSIAAALMVMIFALGRVSGAHFNPAVTLAVLACGGDQIGPKEALNYWMVQFVGGAVGAMMYTITEHGRTFPLEVGKGFAWPHVAVAEILFTFLLCYVVLAVTIKPKTQFFGVAIASCVTAGGVAIGTVSGGVLNPAVAFGVSITSVFGGGNFWHCIPFVFFEILAGGFAAACWRITRPVEKP